MFTRLHAAHLVLSRWKMSTPDKKQLTRRLTFDLDIESTYRQPDSYKARPMDVDDGLEDIRWIRGLGSERVPAASYALLPNLKKVYFCHRRGLEMICRLFSIHPPPTVLESDAWTAPATYHRPRCEHCDQRVGRSPERARPVQIS